MIKDDTDQKAIGAGVARLVAYIVAYIITGIVVTYLVVVLLPGFGIDLSPYNTYIHVSIALAFGYLIVSGFANLAYASVRGRYGHSTAAALKNMFRIVGLGVLAAAIAGGVAGGASGVALGGFLGVVVGFASQQVLGQALAGLFLLMTRPFRIDDYVKVSDEDGKVDDMSTLFTMVEKDDGTKVLIPNNSILGNKIYLLVRKRAPFLAEAGRPMATIPSDIEEEEAAESAGPQEYPFD